MHGRSPFEPRFDGTDRWLQRSFVVTDLHTIGADLDGRVIITSFGDDATGPFHLTRNPSGPADLPDAAGSRPPPPPQLRLGQLRLRPSRVIRDLRGEQRARPRIRRRRLHPRPTAAFDELFGATVEVYFVWGGSGANVMALASMWRPAGAVICTDVAHIHVDETASPERVVGIKLLDMPKERGKLLPAHIEAHLHTIGVEHHAQPCAISITQSTESGTVYTPSEVAALADLAHRHGMKVHMDGARIANATAALGSTDDALRSFTVDAGVDVISFGGTKNGMMYGEAVVYLDPFLPTLAKFVRKQVGQLPSKMRYVAVQFDALLTDDLWLRNAGHSNAMAQRLYGHVSGATSTPLLRPRSTACSRSSPAASPSCRVVPVLRLGPVDRPSALDDCMGHLSTTSIAELACVRRTPTARGTARQLSG